MNNLVLLRPLSAIVILPGLLLIQLFSAQRLLSEDYPPGELDQIRDLGRAAIEELVARFPNEYGGNDVSRAAVLPVQGGIDNPYFTLQVENAFSRLSEKSGMEIYTRADEQLAAVLDEIGWNESYVDAIDPATIQKLGRLRGADAVVFTRVVVTKREDGGFSVRAICQVKEVETARNLWGGEVIQRSGQVISREQMLFYAKIAGVFLVLILLWSWIRSRLRKARRPR